MAKHLAPSQQKPEKKSQARDKVLPKLVHFRLGGRKKHYERSFELFEIVPVLAAVLLFLLAWLMPVVGWPKILAYGISSLAAAFTLIRRTLLRILNRKLPDEDLLVLIAVILAFCLKEYAAGTFALILYRFSELVQAYMLARSDRGMDVLRVILPEKARIDGEYGLEERVPEAVQEGDLLLVMAGEVFPVDGEVIEGSSEIDLSPLSMQEETRNVTLGSHVLSGAVNKTEDLRIRAERSFEDSAAARLIASFTESDEHDSYMEQQISKYASLYTPCILALAILIGLVPAIITHNWNAGLRRMIILFLISSPGALLLSVPMSYLGALVCAVRHGVLVRGKDRIELLAKVKTMVFGKTGTITDGKYVITDVFPHGVTERELLTVAAAAESFSVHPIADALKRAAGWTPEIAQGVMEVEEIPGKGISAFIEGRHVYVGNAALMEEHGVWCAQPTRSGAAIHVSVENEYWGHLLMSDKVREAAYDAVEDLRAQGVDNMVMLTGDVLSVTRNLAASLNFDMVRAELSAEGKLSAIRYLQRGKGERTAIAYVGDGIHDEEIFEAADLGIVIDALEKRRAMDAADLSLLNGDIRLIPTVRKIASAAYWIAVQNILVICATKMILLLLGAVGVMPILLAAGLDCLAGILASLNTLRIFLIER